MLTPDRGRSDGKFTAFLSESERWRRYDPPLFFALAAAAPAGRSVLTVAERRSELWGDQVMPWLDSV